MPALPTHPPVLPDAIHETLRRALDTALHQTQTIPVAACTPYISQWIQTLQSVIPYANFWPHSRELLWRVLDYLGVVGRTADLIHWLESGIAYSQAHHDPEMTAKLQILWGREKIHQGDPATARTLLAEGAAYFEAANLPYAPALNALANLAVSRSAWDEADEWLRRASIVVEPDDWKEQGVYYRILGAVAIGRGNYEAGLKYHQEGLRRWRMGQEPRYVAFGLVNIGSAMRPLRRFTEAKAHYLEAIAIFQEVGDPVNRAYAQLNLGNIYMLNQEWDQAIDQYYQAEQVLSHSGQRYPLAILYNSWGMSYAGATRWNAAIRAYHQSIAIWTEMENYQMRANDRDNLGLAYMGLGDYQRAYETFLDSLDDLQRVQAPPSHSLFSEVREHLAEAEARLRNTPHTAPPQE